MESLLNGVPGGASGALGACLAAVLLLTLLALVRRHRRAVLARERARDAELLRARSEVEALAHRVAELGEEVVEARRELQRDREYVITSLGTPTGHGTTEGTADPPFDARRAALAVTSTRPPVSELLQDRLVETLARHQGSPVRATAVRVVVRTVALGHGVRRALSPDVLDRATAESHVARRRSRRVRRREVREARRLLRAVREDAA
jgi:hypothetical protein